MQAQEIRKYTKGKCTGGADVVQGGGHVGVAVGACVVDRHNQRDLTTTRQELQKKGTSHNFKHTNEKKVLNKVTRCGRRTEKGHLNTIHTARKKQNVHQ